MDLLGDRNGHHYDCVVIGGGPAGLSAALVLGRARRHILLVDAGRQSNLPAVGVGGLLGFDGRPPGQFYELARQELRAYPSVEFVNDEVTSAGGDEGDFTVLLAGGRSARARRLLLAGGVDYRPPELPGLAELWGDTVFHCPFCHGWEFRDQPLGVLADGDKGLHAALLARAWTGDLVLLTDGSTEIEGDALRRLMAAGVRLDQRRVAGLRARDGRLDSVVFVDGSRLPRTGLLVAATPHRRGDLAEQLGLLTHDSGPVVVDPIDVDHLGRTTVGGVFAAGDLCTQIPQVANAIATGSIAATAIVQSLLSDDPPLGSGLPYPSRQKAENGRAHR